MQSKRKLIKAGLEEDIIQKLISFGLSEYSSILAYSEWELFQLLDVDIYRARGIIQSVSRAVCQTFKGRTLDVILESKSRKAGYLASTIDPLDRHLLGGIPSGSVTEIVSQAGMGKTQMCHMLSVIATLPVDKGGLDGGVIYYDTETAFSAERLVEMAREKYPEEFKGATDIERLVNRVQKHSLQNLEVTIIEHKIKLIVLDSIASVVRKETRGDSAEKRTEAVSKEAALLKNLAEIFDIPVVVTNRVTKKYETGQSYVSPALGTLWAHSVNNRIVLDAQGDKRRMIIAKSPVSPVLSFYFTIRMEGIVCGEEGGVEMNPDNYWGQKIQMK
ncbi:hypothetical protein PROFUN_14366 [Planoprotostelium fungivorum]|uniref:RecA family profile 1 domain-containing protein n=1 Tax=Planoprotostelium fungivorum TaxID=1890364 RepID=A0A2P6N0B8_9EUKA|nr:hypothetical protein PROFUN_14366 [Planoprotostelium fungivorum]